MKTLTVVLGLTALLAGCAQVAWYHPSKSAADFRADAYDCEQVAYGYAANLGQRLAGNPLIVADEQLRCMELKHGWARVRVEPERSVGPPSPRSTCSGTDCIAGRTLDGKPTNATPTLAPLSGCPGDLVWNGVGCTAAKY